MPVTVVQPGFVNRGPKRESEATKRGEVVEVYSIHQPLPPLLNFFPPPPINGGMGACAVTVMQPGFVNRGPKRGSEATKRGGGGGGGVGGGFPPPTVGRFLKIRV